MESPCRLAVGRFYISLGAACAGTQANASSSLNPHALRSVARPLQPAPALDRRPVVPSRSRSKGKRTMTHRMRISRYGALAVWAFALCASSTPARVPDPQPTLSGVADTSTGDLLVDTPSRAVDDGIDATRTLPHLLSDLRPLEGTQIVARRSGNGTRVAEPSTLLLVSFGVFGLIAWSRRR